jgi:hypothetical protein|tara:strand:- start:4 stop:651 length:648 start_codon:yes stop_codon:yes gene_type:complete
MIFTKISDELLDILEPFSDWFFKQDLAELTELANNNDKHTNDLEYSCSEEYLKEVVEKDGEHIGFPEISYSFDMNMDRCPQLFSKKIWELNSELGAFLGARNTAVSVYYPTNGFMGWHNNWNAHGYNILLSYTKAGSGFFKYRDPKTHEIVHLQDPGGWSSKVGYYGRGREPDKVYYHCAGTFEPRITLGFVIPDLWMWRDMVADISGENTENLS